MYDRKFRILVQPISVQKGARHGKGHFYNDPKKLAYYQRIKIESQNYAPAIPIPLGSKIYLAVKFFIKDETQQQRRGYHNQKPDRDRLLNGLQDALSLAGFWKDDKCICAGTIEKFWTEEDMPPHIEVHIKELVGHEYKERERKSIKRK